jgi:hypothetical protein
MCRYSAISHQPQLVIGRNYIILEGVRDGSVWRGHSHRDVLEIRDEQTVMLETIPIPRGDFDAMLGELGAEVSP